MGMLNKRVCPDILTEYLELPDVREMHYTCGA